MPHVNFRYSAGNLVNFETVQKPIPRPCGWAMARGVIVSSMEKMAARYRESIAPFWPSILIRISIILVTVYSTLNTGCLMKYHMWTLNIARGFMMRHGMKFDINMMLPIWSKLWESPNAHTSPIWASYGQGCHCEKHGEDGREMSRVHCTILTKHSEKDIDNIGIRMEL